MGISVNDAFPSKYLKVEDLKGREIPVVILRVLVEEVGMQKDRKLVLYFERAVKGMICNKTNAQRLALVYGDDTDDWLGKKITLYAEMTEFGGQSRWGLRVRVQQQQRAVDPQFVAARQQVQQHLAGNGKPAAYAPPTTAFDPRDEPLTGDPLGSDDAPF